MYDSKDRSLVLNIFFFLKSGTQANPSQYISIIWCFIHIACAEFSLGAPVV